jgi:DNA-binding ferritin-like protein
MEEIISVLFHSRTQAHTFHLGAKGEGSFAIHKALNEYYDGIVDIADGLAESWQGKYGIIKYKNITGLEQFQSKEQVIAYFEKVLKIIEIKRNDIKESYIQNQIDNVDELIYSTLYLIKELS